MVGADLAHGTRAPAARPALRPAPARELSSRRWRPGPRLSSRIEKDSDPRAPRGMHGALLSSRRRRCASRRLSLHASRRLSLHASRRLATRLKIVDRIYSGLVLEINRVYLPAAAMLLSNTFAARRLRAACRTRWSCLNLKDEGQGTRFRESSVKDTLFSCMFFVSDEKR